jgi:hypothetical protein
MHINRAIRQSRIRSKKTMPKKDDLRELHFGKGFRVIGTSGCLDDRSPFVSVQDDRPATPAELLELEVGRKRTSSSFPRSAGRRPRA